MPNAPPELVFEAMNAPLSVGTMPVAQPAKSAAVKSKKQVLDCMGAFDCSGWNEKMRKEITKTAWG